MVDIADLYLNKTTWEFDSEPVLDTRKSFVMPPPQVVIPAASAAQEAAKQAVRVPVVAPVTSAVALSTFVAPGVYCELGNPYACHAPDKGMVFQWNGPALGKRFIHDNPTPSIEENTPICEENNNDSFMDLSELGFSPYEPQDIDLENPPAPVWINPNPQINNPHADPNPLIILPAPKKRDLSDTETDFITMSSEEISSETVDNQVTQVLDDAEIKTSDKDYKKIFKIVKQCILSGEDPNLALLYTAAYKLSEIDEQDLDENFITYNAQQRSRFITAIRSIGVIDISYMDESMTPNPLLLTPDEAIFMAAALHPLLPQETRGQELDLTRSWRIMEGFYDDILTGKTRIIPERIAYQTLANTFNEKNFDDDQGKWVFVHPEIPQSLKEKSHKLQKMLEDAFRDSKLKPVIENKWEQLNFDEKNTLLMQYETWMEEVYNNPSTAQNPPAANILALVLRLEILADYFKSDDRLSSEFGNEPLKNVVSLILDIFYGAWTAKADENLSETPIDLPLEAIELAASEESEKPVSLDTLENALSIPPTEAEPHLYLYNERGEQVFWQKVLIATGPHVRGSLTIDDLNMSFVVHRGRPKSGIHGENEDGVAVVQDDLRKKAYVVGTDVMGSFKSGKALTRFILETMAQYLRQGIGVEKAHKKTWEDLNINSQFKKAGACLSILEFDLGRDDGKISYRIYTSGDTRTMLFDDKGEILRSRDGNESQEARETGETLDNTDIAQWRWTRRKHNGVTNGFVKNKWEPPSEELYNAKANLAYFAEGDLFLEEGQRLVVSSDGLTDFMPSSSVHHLLSHSPSAFSAARALWEGALGIMYKGDGGDNFFTVVIERKNTTITPNKKITLTPKQPWALQDPARHEYDRVEGEVTAEVPLNYIAPEHHPEFVHIMSYRQKINIALLMALKNGEVPSIILRHGNKNYAYITYENNQFIVHNPQSITLYDLKGNPLVGPFGEAPVTDGFQLTIPAFAWWPFNKEGRVTIYMN